jgi:hypothetical protein
MNREVYYCKKCQKQKPIQDFYKCNSSICKDCKKNISKIYREKNKNQDKYTNILELLISKINSMEILIDEIHKNTSTLKNTENKFTEIEDTINKINAKNKKINILLNNIKNFNNKPIINNDYENQMKEIMED